MTSWSGWKTYRPGRRWLAVFNEQDEEDDSVIYTGGGAEETKETASNSNGK